MRLEEYREIYDKVSLPKEADERILQKLTEEVSSSGIKQKKKGIRFAGVAAVVVLVLALGIMQFPAVASSTQDLVSRLTIMIDGKAVQVERVEGVEYGEPTSTYVYSDSPEYLSVNPDAPKKECKMASLDEVSEALGIDLLQSEDAHEQKNCIRYTPYVSNSGALNGVILQDTFYALGDIRDPKIKVSKDLEKDGTISYREGEKYHSPIMMEALIRTDNAEGVDEENRELDYSGRFNGLSGKNAGTKAAQETYGIENLTGEDAGGMIVQEIHEIESLGVEAEISVDVSGSHTWNKMDGEEIYQGADAIFTYQGVEYRYVGAVSIETMLEFLEGLEIP